jgi:hypothetical protein
MAMLIKIMMLFAFNLFFLVISRLLTESLQLMDLDIGAAIIALISLCGHIDW